MDYGVKSHLFASYPEHSNSSERWSCEAVAGCQEESGGGKGA